MLPRMLSGVNPNPIPGMSEGNDEFNFHAVHEEYRTLHSRLESFSNWPSHVTLIEKLAEAGFYYTGEGEDDECICFACGFGMNQWGKDDDPWVEHCKSFDACPHVLADKGDDFLYFNNRIEDIEVTWTNTGLNNIAYTATTAETTALKHDTKTQPVMEEQQNANESYGSSPADDDQNAPRLQYQVFTVPRYKAKREEFRSLGARLATFTSWPPQMAQRPKQLADAGLYYTGFGDHCRCFACDGGLRKWEPGEDPWIEHCRHFPTCPFAREIKGNEFFNRFQHSLEQTTVEHDAQQLGDENSTAVTQAIVQEVLDKHGDTLCMPFPLDHVRQAIKELVEQGNRDPDITDIVTRSEVLQERILNRNQQLKSLLLCHTCQRNQANVLFIPCTHLMYCMDCTQHRDSCPKCNRPITGRIRTFMTSTFEHDVFDTSHYSVSHEQYRSMERRLDTFARWPTQMAQRPEQLANAGIFYTGIGDHCCCFACNGDFMRWKPDDNPWKEHCRRFPTCPYARKVKGDEFINCIQHSTEDTADEGATNQNDIENNTAVQEILEKYRNILALVYALDDVREAVLELVKQGNRDPEVADVVTLLHVVQERDLDDNRRLKCLLWCNICHTRQKNALFLPCTHHMYCMECTQDFQKCPKCNRPIAERICTCMTGRNN